MPPRLKRCKTRHCSDSCGGRMCPRVILRPLMADPTGQGRSHLSTLPAVAALFNKPDFSDIRLHVGDDTYFCHRLVLCAGSEVFAKMLGSDWAESKKGDLTLEEDEDSAKVFDRLLYYLYSGRISISESFVVPLFMLADKYDVKLLYDECAKIIENGLKVYVVESPLTPDSGVLGCHSQTQLDVVTTTNTSTSSDTSSSGEFEDSEDDSEREQTRASPNQMAAATSSSSTTRPGKTLELIGSETFPMGLVIKMLWFWSNERINSAALYNLEARLGNQIRQRNFIMWNTLSQNLVVRMLSDTHFCYDEYILFQAAKAWLASTPERQSMQMKTEVLSKIRFPILTCQQLYHVDKDEALSCCPEAVAAVREAMRYQLFQHISSAEDAVKWKGPLFEKRKPRGH